MVGGGVASETDAIETVQYLAEEIQAITRTCRQMGGKKSEERTKFSCIFLIHDCSNRSRLHG